MSFVLYTRQEILLTLLRFTGSKEKNTALPLCFFQKMTFFKKKNLFQSKHQNMQSIFLADRQKWPKGPLLALLAP